MQYVSNHLKPHKIISAPHHFTLAVLLSPIHAGEMYYKRKYHLNFVHAKKLFFFDIGLVAACFVLAFSTYFWFVYDPTISRLVDLRLTTETHNETGIIRSGEHVAYSATVTNNAEIALHDAVLSFQMPRGFIVEAGSLDTTLDILEPNETQTVTIEGFLFENVDTDHHVSAIIRYRQENNQLPEQKIRTIIQNLRGSVILTKLSTAPSAVLGAPTTFTLEVTNDDHHSAAKVIVPLKQDGVRFVPAISPTIAIINDEWIIENLSPKATATLSGTMVIEQETVSVLTLTPLLLNPNNERITQRSVKAPITIVKPSINVSSNWNNTAPMNPADERELTITIKNTGQATLDNINIEIPLANTGMSLVRLTSENGGTIKNGTYTVRAPFATLEPNTERSMTLRIDAPLRVDSGTNISLKPDPFVIATIAGTDSATIRTAVPVTPIPISTLVTLSAESRYYTEEGDQLGRGPLPPMVGEETKYWALIAIGNSTNGLDDVRFSATLPDHVSYTGRTSVSHGDAPVYTPSSKKVTWNLSRLEARDTAGIYMELALMPSEGQRNTSPKLLENINISATDAFTNIAIQKTAPALDISIPKDEIGNQRGTVVQ